MLDWNILKFLFLLEMWKKGEIEYDHEAPLAEYNQNSSNDCCFSGSASEFTASGENNAARDIAMLIW